MIGAYALGEVALGELKTADYFTPALETLYYSANGYTTAPGDTPASRWYDERAEQPLLFWRSIVGDRLGGLARERAELKLGNGDGALDLFQDLYALDMREVDIEMGEAGAAYSAFGTIFTGYMLDAAVSEDAVTVRLGTRAMALRTLLHPSTYGGTGGTDGGADLKGQVKPLCFGRVYNVTPVLVDATNLVYQVHDGAIQDVPAVYDGQVALTKVVGTPTAGQYAVDTANGTFQLGDEPVFDLTCDVDGRHDGADWPRTVANIVADLIDNYSPLASSDRAASSFTQLNTDQPAVVGLYLPEPAAIDAAIDALLRSAGCYGYFTLASKLIVGQFAAPGATATVELDDDNILSAQRDPLPGGLTPIAYRWSVGYQRNHSPGASVADGAPAARRAFAASEYRVAAASDSGVLANYLLAVDAELQRAPFTTLSDAQDEADRALAIYGVPRALVTLAVKPALWTVEIGTMVKATYRRAGLSGGAYGRVVAINLNAARNQAELVLLV